MQPFAVVRRAFPHHGILDRIRTGQVRLGHVMPARTALIALVLALSGCATGMGGFPQGGGSYPGSSYPDQSYPQQSTANQLVGTVQNVDPGGGRIVLDARSSGYGSTSRVEVFFDQRTQLVYQGQAYPVSGLEPGDEIRIATTRSGNRLWAGSIELLRNVRDSGGYNDGGYNNGGYNGGNQNSGGNGNDLRGEVGYVDTRSRFIELARGAVGGNYGAQRIRYDERTLVEYQGQRYRVENLQRGDIVRIQARQYGNEWVAERIWVEQDANRR